MEKTNDIQIRLLNQGEQIPYRLLLLADPSKDLIEKYISFSEIYVAEQNGNILGTYILCPVNSDSIEIKNIAVEMTHQGRGLGKLLLSDAIQRAGHKGFKEIIIGTANSSIGQLYLYQKHGFEINEIKKNFFIINYKAEIKENDIQAKHMIMLVKHLL